ncbi:unnamed protein product, partial [Trichogramma brassicae]
SQKSHKMLVFMATRGMVEFYTEILSTVLCEPDNEEYGVGLNTLDNVQFFKLHGDMVQKDRDKTFKDFCAAESGVLLSTDVGARGLNWDVNTVVQYTGPTSLSDYVHRAGRAGRAGALGSAVIFLVPSEVEFVRSLESRRIRIKQDVDVEVILKELIGRFTQQNDWKAGATNLQNKFESLILENKEFKTMAFNAYTSWVRFYSSYPVEMRSVFNRKELHLGHFAKSFALRETPRDIGGAAKKDQDKKKADQRQRHQKPNNRNGNNKRRVIIRDCYPRSCARILALLHLVHKQWASMIGRNNGTRRVVEPPRQVADAPEWIPGDPEQRLDIFEPRDQKLSRSVLLASVCTCSCANYANLLALSDRYCFIPLVYLIYFAMYFSLSACCRTHQSSSHNQYIYTYIICAFITQIRGVYASVGLCTHRDDFLNARFSSVDNIIILYCNWCAGSGIEISPACAFGVARRVAALMRAAAISAGS